MVSNGIDDHEVQQLLRQLIQRGENMTPVMRDIADILDKSVQENFEREGRPRWPALAASTIAQREKKGYWPGKMLRRQDFLHKSWVTSYDKTRAVAGSNWPTARIHELGGQAGRGHKARIPARPVRRLSFRELGEIKFTLMQYLFKRQ